jgi:hypothetical protein
MLKLSLLKGFLFALFLCLWAANAPAQEQMIPPPVPDFYPSPPPDPDTLPPPPPMDWEALTPQDSQEGSDEPPSLSVPAPQAEASIPPAPPPVIEPLIPGLPDPAGVESAKPDLEIWRPDSETPQVPARLTNLLAPALVTGSTLVTLRVQFDPANAGKSLYVRPGFGISIGAVDAVLTISPTGECILPAQLYDGVSRSHIIFYCEGVKTILPVVRASLADVEVQEALTGGG